MFWKVIKVHVQKDLSHIKCRQDLIESVLKAWSKLHRTRTVSQKGCHFYFCNNFDKCTPILIILLLLYSQIYC